MFKRFLIHRFLNIFVRLQSAVVTFLSFFQQVQHGCIFVVNPFARNKFGNRPGGNNTNQEVVRGKKKSLQHTYVIFHLSIDGQNNARGGVKDDNERKEREKKKGL